MNTTTAEATRIEFAVYGMPKTAGSKKAFNVHGRKVPIVVDDAGPKGKAWRTSVQDAARGVFSDDLLRGPLGVTMSFFVPRPKGHFGKRGFLNASATPYPAKRPDLLKWARAIEDALTGVVWFDDAQIVTEHLEKRFGEPARCEITIEML